MTTDLSAPLIGPIHFRSLISQLNPVEITSFIKTVNPEILIDALSCYFIHGSPNKEKIKHNEICNDVVSSIIESRDQLPSKQIVFKLDALPSGLIGACGSYLDQRSYARLSTTNRNIYLGCNTPSTLKTVTLHYRSEAMHEMLDFPAISSAKTLVLDIRPNANKEYPLLDDEMHFIASQIAKLTRLKSLNVRIVNSEFMRIIASHETTNQRVNYLSALLWEDNDGASDRFISSITAFKHIQFLRVCILGQRRPLDDDSMIKPLVKMCSNLRGLNFLEDYARPFIEMSLLRAVGHHLHYLHLNIYEDDQVAALKNINFQNLQELQSYHGGAPISAVLNTAINLEKIRLGDEPELIVETLTKCQRLKYLELRHIHEIETVLGALERGLFQTKNVHRDTLKIRISTPRLGQQSPISRPKECVIKLDRIVNSLSVNKVDQWMIILELKGLCFKDPAQFIKSLQASLTADIADTFVFQNIDNDIVLITNPGCTICGWSESWLMSSGRD